MASGGGGLRSKRTALGLSEGIGVALTNLKAYAPDAMLANVRALGQDKVFVLFLAMSVAGFAKKAGDEYKELYAQRKAAKKLAKSASGQQLAPSQARPMEKRSPHAASGFTSPSFWKELRYLACVAIPGPTSPGARLLGTQFCLLVMRTLVTVRMTKLSTYYLTKAISKASWRHWSRWVFHFGGWMTSATAVNSGLRYVESLIAVELREQLSRHVHASYLKGNAFYRTAVLRDGGTMDVDQRVTADIADFSREAAFLYGHSFKPILEFSLSLTEAARELGFSRPIALFASQVVITTVLRGMSPRLGRMIAKEQQLEGAFRHKHARLIAHAEEVAFLRGGDTERQLLNKSLGEVVSTQRWHALQRIKKSMTDNIAKFQGLLFGGVFVHIPFMVQRQMGEGERISAFRATEELMLRCGSAFTEMLLLGKNLDELSGYVSRLAELFRRLEHVSKLSTGASMPSLADPGADGEASIRMEHLSVGAPEPGGESRLLVKDLTLEVTRGRNVLVTGPNGCGKTSLFRTVAGLWPAVAGSACCPLDKLMWLPQKPYLVLGTLRDQVTYPKTCGFQRRFDERITECLQRAGLGKLLENAGLDLLHEEWNDVLSGGERQRMGFARLFYHEPQFAVLDEATSAVSRDGEEQLYAAVQAQGTTVFSIAHRLELRKFHQMELRVVGDGSGAFELTRL